jgi:hypothetical protein
VQRLELVGVELRVAGEDTVFSRTACARRWATAFSSMASGGKGGTLELARALRTVLTATAAASSSTAASTASRIFLIMKRPSVLGAW